MNEQFLQLFRIARRAKAVYFKLWENLSIETMGPRLYHTHLVPLYEKILNLLGPEKKLIVHYDGKLSLIADAIARLPFHGIDSLTPPPEGDLTMAQARAAWPDKFLWIHPTLSWDSLSDSELAARITQTCARCRRHPLLLGTQRGSAPQLAAHRSPHSRHPAAVCLKRPADE